MFPFAIRRGLCTLFWQLCKNWNLEVQEGEVWQEIRPLIGDRIKFYKQ
jgi:hypothetical protein